MLLLQSCVTALDQTWHPEHFVCASCGRPFGDSGFHERDGKPFCREDYYAMFAPRCGGCGQPIMDNYISALSAHWHSECFVCAVSYYDTCSFPLYQQFLRHLISVEGTMSGWLFAAIIARSQNVICIH